VNLTYIGRQKTCAVTLLITKVFKVQDERRD
jgi:hypothetical protein